MAETTSGVKGYCLNYDSNVMFPYTLLDCIIDEQGSRTGAAAIVAALVGDITDKCVLGYDPTGGKLTSLDTLKSSEEAANYYLSGDGTFRTLGSSSVVSLAVMLGTTDLIMNTSGVCRLLLNSNDFDHDNKTLKLKTYDSTSFFMNVSTTDAGSPLLYTYTKGSGDVGLAVRYSNNIGYSGDTACALMVYDKTAGFKNSSANVGSTKTPVYLASGIFKPIPGSIGGTATPIYINNSGELTAFSNTIGNNKTIMWMDGGILKASEANVGGESSENKTITPVYLSDGQITAMTQSIGNDGKTILCVDAGKIKASSETLGSTSKFLYLSSGKLTECTGDIGGDSTPVCIKNGVISKCANLEFSGSEDSLYVATSSGATFMTPHITSGTDPSQAMLMYQTDSEGSRHIVWAGIGEVTSVQLSSASDGNTYYVTGVKSDASGLFNSTNGVYCTNVYFKNGTLFNTSDENLKTFTEDLNINLDNLATIKKGLFYWNDDENKRIDLGVSAQSVEALFPQLVDESNGVKHVSYEKLSVVALAAIDKLNKENKKLRKELKDLREKFEELAEKVDEL